MNQTGDPIPVVQVTPPTPNQQPGPIYVRAQKGYWQRVRTCMGWFFMLLFALLPWIQYQGHQAILLDIGQQRFHFFAAVLWPQDLLLLALLFVLAAFTLFFVTTSLGRVWCGYMCPQTIWTFWFIWCEEIFEGKANKRRKLDQAPWHLEKILRKTGKHLAWLAISLFTALTFVGYFVNIHDLFAHFFLGEASLAATAWVLFFTLATYGNAGWMRHIMCTHICPYSRLQSVMFDQDTFIVGYDTKRGEPRGPRARNTPSESLGLGDCIDCKLCIQVCPAGIDIRHGLQYECINCGACIDACDHTMEKMNYPKGLIQYTSEQALQGRKTQIVRPKLIGYGGIMLLMCTIFFYFASNISPLSLEVLRDRNQLYQETSEGLIENVYTLKILNKTLLPQTYQIAVQGLERVVWIGPKTVDVAPGEVLNVPVSLQVDPEIIIEKTIDIQFIIETNPLDGENVKYIKESKFFNQL